MTEEDQLTRTRPLPDRAQHGAALAVPTASSRVITLPADPTRRTGLPTGIRRIRMHPRAAGWAYATFTNSLPKFLPWSRPRNAAGAFSRPSDLNNVEVADQMSLFLSAKGLDLR
jgi:hypothetical protein